MSTKLVSDVLLNYRISSLDHSNVKLHSKREFNSQQVAGKARVILQAKN